MALYAVNVKKCPNYEGKTGLCKEDLPTIVLNLINRLQAENERLKEKGIVVLLKPENAQFENLERFETRQISKEMLPAIVRRVKAEAYKEFAKKLHEELRMYGTKDKFNKAVFLNVVDRVKKRNGG